MKRIYIKPQVRTHQLVPHILLSGASAVGHGAENPETGNMDDLTPGTEDPNADSRLFDSNMWDL